MSTPTANADIIDISRRLHHRARATECTVCRDDYMCPPHQCRDAVDQIRRNLAACTAGAIVVAVHEVEAALADGLADLERLAEGTMRRPVPLLAPGEHAATGHLLELHPISQTP